MGFSELVVAYQLRTNGAGVSQLVGIWQTSPGNSDGEGSSPVVANGIVFVAFNGQLCRAERTQRKRAVEQRLRCAGTNIGAIHWESPIVVNGWVYCSDENGNLTAYSLK